MSKINRQPSKKKRLPKLTRPPGINMTVLDEALIQNIHLGYEEIIVEKEFLGSYGGARVFLVLPVTTDGGRDARVVTKIGLASELRHEYDNYHECVGRALPFTSTQVCGYYEQDKQAALNYAFAGEAALGQTVSLQEYYGSHTLEQVNNTLESLLDKALGSAWYGQNSPLNRTYRAEYGGRLPPAQELANIVSVILPDLSFIDGNRIKIPGVTESFPHPLTVYSGLLDKTLQGRKSYVHGDLHLRNVLVDENGKGWLIDFANVSKQHNLLDFIKLETYIRLMALAPEHGAFSWSEYVQFEQALNADAMGHKSNAPANPHLAKAYAVLQKVRRIARKYMGSDPNFQKEYFPALFLYCLARLKHYQSNGTAPTQLIFITTCTLGREIFEDDIQTLVTHYGDTDREIVSSIAAMLKPADLTIVKNVLNKIEKNEISDKDISEALVAVKHVLKVLSTQGKSLPNQKAIDDYIDKPNIDAKHKIKITLPIIPLLLSYEGEINLEGAVNLENLWNRWRKNSQVPLPPDIQAKLLSVIIAFFLILALFVWMWWNLQPHCPYQGKTDEGTIKNLIQAESQAANSQDIEIIKNIFSPNARITKWNGNNKDEWNDPVIYYQLLFQQNEFKNAEHFNILPVESGITQGVAWYVSGSRGSYRTKPSTTWNEYINLSIPGTRYGSDHWVFRKDNKGCWSIANFAINAGDVQFPP